MRVIAGTTTAPDPSCGPLGIEGADRRELLRVLASRELDFSSVGMMSVCGNVEEFIETRSRWTTTFGASSQEAHPISNVATTSI